MEQIEHEKSAMAKFGKPFSEVHAFLDQFFPDFGPSHRRIFHHQRGVDLMVAKLGPDARAVAEQHILDDIRMFEPMATKIPLDWEWYGEQTFLGPQDAIRLRDVMVNLYVKKDMDDDI